MLVNILNLYYTVAHHLKWKKKNTNSDIFFFQLIFYRIHMYLSLYKFLVVLHLKYFFFKLTLATTIGITKNKITDTYKKKS